MKKQIFTNLEIQDFETLVRNCIRIELEEFKKDKEVDKLMKATEVCDYLKISKVTLYKWLREGKISGYYLATRLFFWKSEIIKSLNKREIK